jgi:hypothetical protein
MKVCKDCGQSKHLDQFRPKLSNKDGAETRCKICRNIRYNKSDPTRVFKQIYNNQILHSVIRDHPAPTYSFATLLTWVDQQANAFAIWNAYVASKFDTSLRPSIDRIDDSLPYYIGNIQLMTWGENKAKSYQSRQLGLIKGGPGGQRPVASFNEDGSLHKTYISIMEAVRDVKGRMHGIASVANGKPVKDGRGVYYQPRTYKGFIWKWISSRA